ncbi:neutral zinc metallopeptidase [Allokutzneria sp. NRRL B-24872]|uniref:neutral zinc metallopeptidase n=1 Tax=Allokutzneria sp. NRRL B-24872 TaxID=1137961 RepID=UPI000A368791|nr:neutral zinc metallopeptidase [Allokutzneria sp. NRRL B-24872]
MSRRTEGNSPLTFVMVITLLVAGVLGMAVLGLPAQQLPDPAASASRTPLPLPTGGAAARRVRLYTLADHPVLAAGIMPDRVSCPLPPFDASPVPLHAYYEATARCLDGVWQPVLTKLNLPSARAKIDSSDSVRDTPCGPAPPPSKAVAFYCSANETIYMPRDRVLSSFTAHPRWVFLLSVLAHEYGHHVQNLSGMLTAAHDEQEEAGQNALLALEWQRRVELQATCLAGLSIWAASGEGSLTKADGDAVIAEHRESKATSDTHGSRSNNVAWVGRGHRSGATASCNTWSASSDEVR